MPQATEITTDQAHYVGAIVAASLEPGGPLHVALSDLLTEAELVAQRAAGIADDAPDDKRADWPATPEHVMGQIIGEITEAMYQSARRFLAEVVPA